MYSKPNPHRPNPPNPTHFPPLFTPDLQNLPKTDKQQKLKKLTNCLHISLHLCYNGELGRMMNGKKGGFFLCFPKILELTWELRMWS